MWSLLPAWPAFIVFRVLFQGAGLALQPRSWLTRGLFALFKATIWRIVEYNKGAVAALELIITICLTHPQAGSWLVGHATSADQHVGTVRRR